MICSIHFNTVFFFACVKYIELFEMCFIYKAGEKESSDTKDKERYEFSHSLLCLNCKFSDLFLYWMDVYSHSLILTMWFLLWGGSPPLQYFCMFYCCFFFWSNGTICIWLYKSELIMELDFEDLKTNNNWYCRFLLLIVLSCMHHTSHAYYEILKWFGLRYVDILLLWFWILKTVLCYHCCLLNIF